MLRDPMHLANTNEPEKSESEQPADIFFRWAVNIPMRDGVILNATLYKPKEAAAVPAIFTMTPYIADSYHARAFYFARHGYAFLLVDCRGRGNSGGDFEPFVNDSQDGFDVIEWLAQQDWCDGQVSMWGGSYAGFNQWMALKDNPPHLKTIVPAAAAHAGVDFPFFKNIFFSYEIQWLTLVSGRTGNSALFEEDRFWIDKFQEWFHSGRSFRELDQIAGNPSTIFQNWLMHPTLDEYWRRMWLTPDDYARLEGPILTITGQYDGDQPGALHYYRQHMLHGSEAGKANHYLIIGPWDHAGTRTPNREFGGLKFGEAMLLDLNKLHQDWYDWTLKQGSKPELLKDRIVYYVAGAETWKTAPDLESISPQTRCLYLSSENGQANDVFHSGSLTETVPHVSLPDRYIYDPLDFRYAEFEKEHVKEYFTTQRRALHLFGQGLVYHTPPFEADLEISGFIRLVAWLAIDQPDTDFDACLYMIDPDGGCTWLSEDFLRARYRLSPAEENLVTPGEINRYDFDGFNFFARLVKKGSRLRLLLSAPNSIQTQKNYNSGGVVADETPGTACTVSVTLYHDREHPSCLEIPIRI